MNSSSHLLNFPLPNLERYLEYGNLSSAKVLSNDEKISKQQMDAIKKRVESLSSSTREILSKTCEKEDCSLTAYNFFNTNFQAFFVFIKALNPTDDDLDEARSQFFSDFFRFLYFTNEQSRVSEDVPKKLKKLNQKLIDEFDGIESYTHWNTEKITMICRAFNEFIDEPNLFFVNMALLARHSSFEIPYYSITIIDLLNAFNTMCEEFAKLTPMIILLLESTLIGMSSSSDLFERGQIKDRLDRLENFRINFCNLCSKEIPSSILDFKNGKLERMNKINDTVSKFINYFDSIYNIEELSTKIKESKPDSSELPDLKKKLRFYEKIDYLHFLLKSFVLSKSEYLSTAAMSLTEYCRNQPVNRLKRLEQCKTISSRKQKVTNPIQSGKPEKQQVEDDRSIEELLKNIGVVETKGTTSTHHLGNKHSKSKNKSAQSNKQVSRSSANCYSNPSEQTSPIDETVSKHERSPLSSILALLGDETPEEMAKNFFQQAHMYYEDLLIAHQQIMDETLSDEVRRFYIMTFLLSAYFCFESLFQGEKAKKDPANFRIIGNGHNLNKLADTIMNKKEIIKQFFLTNFWVAYPFEQFRDLKKFAVPQILSQVKSIYEAQNLKEASLQATIREIKDYFPKIQECIQLFPSIKNAKMEVCETDSPAIFTLTDHFPLKEFQQLRDRCEKFKGRLSQTSHFKFSQVICHLKLIEGICEELNKKHISSGHFSLLSRQLIFWESTVLEGLFQVVCLLKTGIDTRIHDLVQIQKLSGNRSTSDKGKNPLLLKKLANIHNISRYPFTTQKEHIPQEKESLHDLILKVELLRKNAKLGEDKFEDVKAVTSKLQQTTNSILDYIKTKVIPVLEVHCEEKEEKENEGYRRRKTSSSKPLSQSHFKPNLLPKSCDSPL